MRLRRNSLIYSLIHSLIYSLIYSLIHSLIFLLSPGFRCVLKFLATRLSAISFLWPRPPQRDDASKKIVCSTRVGSQIRKKTARAKAQTLHFDRKSSIPRENGTRGNRERVALSLAGGALRALPRWVIGKTLTVNRVPWQSARKVSWLFSGQVEIKEGALAALPRRASVNATTHWVRFQRAACAQRTRPECLRRSAAFCGSSCLALQCRRVSSNQWQRWRSSPSVAWMSC